MSTSIEGTDSSDAARSAARPAVHDVVVVGDGPAGSALAAASARRGLDVLLVGVDDEWTATYSSWIDDVDEIALLADVDVWAHRLPTISVDVGARRTIDRPYGVIDNASLRAALRSGVAHRSGRVDSISVDGVTRVATISTSDGRSLRSRVVIDATGWPGWSRRTGQAAELEVAELVEVPRQTAIGVVLESPPSGPLGTPTVMDFGRPGSAGDAAALPGDVVSFAYSVPVADGWLVEETVLTASPPVAPDRLLGRLAARLGTTVDELVESAIRLERVDIPMGGPLPDLTSDVVAFGAAAGMIHPATGYSIAGTLERADVLADAIVELVGRPDAAPRELWDVVWPRGARRTRVLHDFGSSVLLDLDVHEIRMFFDVFFDLPVPDWSRYLRISTPPAEIARVMARMFAAAPWSLRRRLVGRNPLALARVLRP